MNLLVFDFLFNHSIYYEGKINAHKHDNIISNKQKGNEYCEGRMDE